MLYTMPDYYKQFRCLADKCGDTCCAGWEIMIDQKSMEKYKKVGGGFGNCLNNSIDYQRGCFKQYNRRCAFLNEDNLCDIYSELGPTMLCNTCKKYPRHMEEYEGARDLSLSLSCPEVARMLLSHEERVRFFTKEKPGEDEDFEEFDFLLYTKLLDVRSFIIGTLQNRSTPVNVRAALGLVLAHDLQNRIDSKEYFTMDRLISRYKKKKIVEYLVHKLKAYEFREEERYITIRNQFELLSKLEILKPEWSTNCRESKKILYSEGMMNYLRNRRRFLSFMEERTDLSCSYSVMLEQLYIYFVYGYFSGAVYDNNAFGKLKFAIVNTVLIQELWQARWQLNGKLSFEDIVDIAHSYSREIEHSDNNLKKIDKYLKKKPFYLEKLLVTLLS